MRDVTNVEEKLFRLTIHEHVDDWAEVAAEAENFEVKFWEWIEEEFFTLENFGGLKNFQEF